MFCIVLINYLLVRRRNTAYHAPSPPTLSGSDSLLSSLLTTRANSSTLSLSGPHEEENKHEISGGETVVLSPPSMYYLIYILLNLLSFSRYSFIFIFLGEDDAYDLLIDILQTNVEYDGKLKFLKNRVELRRKSLHDARRSLNELEVLLLHVQNLVSSKSLLATNHLIILAKD